MTIPSPQTPTNILPTSYPITPFVPTFQVGASLSRLAIADAETLAVREDLVSSLICVLL